MKQFPFTDEQILRWEQQRGTMPERVGSDSDAPAIDRKQLREIRKAYQRTPAAQTAQETTP